MNGEDERTKQTLDEFDQTVEETERLAKELEKINHPKEKEDGQQSSQSSG